MPVLKKRPEEDVGPLELVLQAVVRHLAWVLGTKPRLSKRIVGVPNG